MPSPSKKPCVKRETHRRSHRHHRRPARASQVLREPSPRAPIAPSTSKTTLCRPRRLQYSPRHRRAVKDEKFDLIFTGLQSDDYGYAQTGVILAQILGWPHATIIMQIEKTDAGIRVKRELEAGFFQFVDIPLPRSDHPVGHQQASLCHANRNQAGKKQAAAQSSVGRSAIRHGRKLAEDRKALRPQKSKNTEFLEGPPAEVAKKLVEKLKNEMRVI